MLLKYTSVPAQVYEYDFEDRFVFYIFLQMRPVRRKINNYLEKFY